MIPFTTDPDKKIEICKIAVEMDRSGLDKSFVSDAVDLASEYEGAYDLMALWHEAEDSEARDEIIADLQEEVDRAKEMRDAYTRPFRAPKINFKELSGNAEQVVSFKRQLRDLVDRWGGISELARKTGIPQPSLSRFFNSASFPRNTTIYKILKALLPEEDYEQQHLWAPSDTIQQMMIQINAVLSSQDGDRNAEPI